MMRLDLLRTTMPDSDQPKKYFKLKKYNLDEMAEYTNNAIGMHERSKKSA